MEIDNQVLNVEFVKKMLKSMGITQEKLAAAIGVSTQGLMKMIRTGNCRLDSFVKLALYFNADLAELVNPVILANHRATKVQDLENRLQIVNTENQRLNEEIAMLKPLVARYLEGGKGK